MMFSKGPQEMSGLFDFLGPESVTVIDIYWKIILRYFHVTSAPRKVPPSRILATVHSRKID